MNKKQHHSTFVLLCLALCLSSFTSSAKNPTEYDPSVPEPTLTGIKYGDHPRNVLDLWQASSKQPTPLVLVIHGGGWNGKNNPKT